MLAGYIPAWTSFSEAVDWVAAAAGCARDEALDALLTAIYDGEVQSRFGDTGEPIEPIQWRPPVIFIDGYEMPLIGNQRPIELRRADVERLWRRRRAAEPIRDAAGEAHSLPLAPKDAALSIYKRRGPPAEKFSQVKEAMICSAARAIQTRCAKKSGGLFMEHPATRAEKDFRPLD